MEFPDVGKHCDVSTCKQLDFLPYVCGRCLRTFCDEHRSYDGHNCPIEVDKRVPTCPLCNQIIEVLPGENINRKVNRHIDAGCPRPEPLKTAQYGCTYHRCPNHELQRIVCPFCNQQYCLKHKQPGDHNCDKQPHKGAAAPAASEPNQWTVWNKVSDGVSKISEIVAKHTSKLKDNATTRKMALSKLKQNAIGQQSVPQEKRVYLEVIFPMDSKVEPKWFFFHEDRKYGVVLDEVSSAGKIKNQNHVPDAPKLQLIALKTGKLIPLNKSIKELIGEIGKDDPILLEFVDNSAL